MPVKTQKPKKPYKDFPLFAHATGQWAKKIKGKMWYFGTWNEPQAALDRFRKEVDDIQSGRDPRKLATGVAGVATQVGCTIIQLVNSFLTEKEDRMLAGRLSKKMFVQYRDACKVIIDRFGKDSLVSALVPQDFSALLSAFPKTWGLSMVGSTVGRVRSVFLFAAEADLIEKPVKFGSGFKEPSELEKWRDNAEKISDRGRLDFTAAEAKLLIEQTKNPIIRACILLGLNAGFGNTDCSDLTTRAVNLESGWIDYPRPKTGVERRVPMWLETVEAIKGVSKVRPVPKDAAHDSLIFITREGMPLVWDRMTPGTNGQQSKLLQVNNLSLTFGRLLTKHGLRKSGHNFYSLRRTFETVAGQTKDQVAVNAIMGRDDGSMPAEYLQGIDDERLIAVTNHVRTWLFG